MIIRKITFILFLITIINVKNYGQSIGIGTAMPDSSAILELSSNDKGFLPTRIALSVTNIAAPVINPKAGLLIYNTAISGTAPFDVIPGYYFWNGTSWYPVMNKGKQFGDMQYWDGTKWIIIPIGQNGQSLTICNGKPIWGSCNGTINLSPVNNPDVGQLTSNAPNANGAGGGTQFTMAAWTSGGPLNIRNIMRFDYSSIPLDVIIDSVKLQIYATLNPQGGNGVDAHYGVSNACYVRRIITSWVAPSPFTWNNPPAFTTLNEATIPQSTSSFENSIIDVTALVKDMFQNGNNGFYFGLKTEVTYNVRQYVSSYSTDVARHPKLVVYYHR